MEEKETTFLQNPSLESEGDNDLFPSSGFEKQKVGSELDETSQLFDDSGDVPRKVPQFYFVKLWPTDPDSVSKIRKAERVIEEMNQDHLQITENIKEKMSERDHLTSQLKNSNYYYRGFKGRMASQGSVLNDLHMALDELCFAKNAPSKVSNRSYFKGELDNHKLNFLMVHGSKNLSEEKQILREMNMSQQSDVAPFSSLDRLGYIINGYYYMNYGPKLLTEIKQFQLQRERAAGNAAVKGKIWNYVALKKALKDQIKLMCDDTLEHRKERMALRTKVRHIEKELEAINKAISSLQKKMAEKYQKKAEAYQSILRLKKVYHGEIFHYEQYRSLMNNVHQLAENKDIEAL